MIQLFLMIITFINAILLFNCVGTAVLNITSLPALFKQMGLFQRFKDNYDRVYPDQESEQQGFNNFVNNLAEVNELNKEHPGHLIAYQLNRFADQNPEEINERFGIQMKPYDNMEHENKEAIQREQKHKFVEDMHLYDLTEVDDLYEDWKKKWGKANYTKKFDNMSHYYRFVKTVVETNKKKFAGQDGSLGTDADLIREPNKYFYG